MKRQLDLGEIKALWDISTSIIDDDESEYVSIRRHLKDDPRMNIGVWNAELAAIEIKIYDCPTGMIFRTPDWIAWVSYVYVIERNPAYGDIEFGEWGIVYSRTKFESELLTLMMMI